MSEALPHFLCCRFLLSERHQIQHVLELSVGKKKKKPSCFVTTLMQPRVILLWHKLNIEKIRLTLSS